MLTHSSAPCKTISSCSFLDKRPSIIEAQNYSEQFIVKARALKHVLEHRNYQDNINYQKNI